MQETTTNYYKVLGVTQQATDGELKEARRKLLLSFKPSATVSNNSEYDSFVQVVEAYNVLADPAKRRMFDYLGTVVDAHEIVDGLWLGAASATYSKQFMEKCEITSVLSILQVEYKVPVKNHFQIFCDDLDESPLIEHFDKTFEFIELALSNNGKILVHCMAGVSRSPTVVTAYLMRKRKLSFEDAFAIVKAKRDCVGPNDGFMKQLQRYEQQKNNLI